MTQIHLESARSKSEIGVTFDSGILHDRVFVEDSVIHNADVFLALDQVFNLNDLRYLNFMLIFPDDVSMYVFSFLKLPSLLQFAQTCKKALALVRLYRSRTEKLKPHKMILSNNNNDPRMEEDE